MPAASVFVGTNLLFYIRDTRDTARSAIAIRWLRALARAERGRSNLQVMNELTNVLLKRRPDLTAGEIFALVDEVKFLGTDPISLQTVSLSRNLRARYHYSWWDCLLLAAALELGCTHFLSEDMQDGQRISLMADQSLTLVDPFAHSPDDILPQH
jgi:predicted nucleic acid-binding protein